MDTLLLGVRSLIFVTLEGEDSLQKSNVIVQTSKDQIFLVNLSICCIVTGREFYLCSIEYTNFYRLIFRPSIHTHLFAKLKPISVNCFDKRKHNIFFASLQVAPLLIQYYHSLPQIHCTQLQDSHSHFLNRQTCYYYLKI